MSKKVKYTIIENIRANGNSYFTVRKDSFWLWNREQIYDENVNRTFTFLTQQLALNAIDYHYVDMQKQKGYKVVKRNFEYIIKSQS